MVSAYDFGVHACVRAPPQLFTESSTSINANFSLLDGYVLKESWRWLGLGVVEEI